MRLEKLRFGVEVKQCVDCERGICDACSYKFHSDLVSKLPNCNDCEIVRACIYAPQIGENVRINCPLHVPKG